MKCPRDRATLTAQKRDDIRFHLCERCDGMWFEEDALKSLLHRERQDNHQPHLPEALSHLTYDAPALCPVDGVTLMERIEQDGVHVDVCAEHRGIWLDGGELRQLVEQTTEPGIADSLAVHGEVARSLADRKAVGEAHPRISGWAGFTDRVVGEIVGEVACQVLGGIVRGILSLF